MLEGSSALKDTGHAKQSYANPKQNLISTSLLIPTAGSRRVFAKPYRFSNPITAAAVVLDRNSNGRLE